MLSAECMRKAYFDEYNEVKEVVMVKASEEKKN